MIVTQSEFNDWKASPLTKELLSYVSLLIEDGKEMWASGAYTGESAEQTAQLNAQAQGFIQALMQSVLAISDGTFLEEIVNDD